MRHIHTISFQHAVEGIITAFKSQPNFRVHALAAVVVVMAGWYWQLNSSEWAVLVFTIALVVVAELINTAVEATVDLLVEQHNHYAKIAKDVAAGAVLVSAVASVIVGIFIFLPKII